MYSITKRDKLILAAVAIFVLGQFVDPLAPMYEIIIDWVIKGFSLAIWLILPLGVGSVVYLTLRNVQHDRRSEAERDDEHGAK
ncbi:MAG: hypothetical protein AAGI11_17590 [Pseudomonadota bacterium]